MPARWPSTGASREARAPRSGGVEVDTQGDAFLFAFAPASDALAPLRTRQAALAPGPVRVRMGIHTGEPQLTDEGYVGIDVHVAARIAACAPRRPGGDLGAHPGARRRPRLR